ncbi:hypothetical protein J2S40_002083 [Nocardioides luteus]|uniref:Restriction system protein Mrr-like N-terminal domain-containing protein n=1 Tax=Nocardioides luteus TaxID=1844 RepID=A0ABQ5SUB2_9ACTN|nr:hypothetical protein [Nocardioides luteus]MDR7311025.1 hypothetical protein [Nocardioides luteus]GGR67683.1 hypothetical protein GCM10010197_38890 [Nocardioides luteus]GLJ66571.1 hypothetical protein GCM10017579_06070 [Nocardioides luteus]
MSETDYCELCDLPKSQCIHGRPPAPPAPAPVKKSTTPRVRKTSSTSKTASAPKVVTKSAPRKWTPPAAFAPLILEILENAGGSMQADAVLDELETQLSDQLLPGDFETTPEGELRWRYAARRARQGLLSDGLMTKGTPGVWQLP